jgi:hypothetical protein
MRQVVSIAALQCSHFTCQCALVVVLSLKCSGKQMSLHMPTQAADSCLHLCCASRAAAAAAAARMPPFNSISSAQPLQSQVAALCFVPVYLFTVGCRATPVVLAMLKPNAGVSSSSGTLCCPAGTSAVQAVLVQCQPAAARGAGGSGGSALLLLHQHVQQQGEAHSADTLGVTSILFTALWMV